MYHYVESNHIIDADFRVSRNVCWSLKLISFWPNHSVFDDVRFTVELLSIYFLIDLNKTSWDVHWPESVFYIYPWLVLLNRLKSSFVHTVESILTDRYRPIYTAINPWQHTGDISFTNYTTPYFFIFFLAWNYILKFESTDSEFRIPRKKSEKHYEI